MIRLADRTTTPRRMEVVRKRRAFGLDAPRPPDIRRLEAGIRDWFEANLPSALVLRLGLGDEAQANPALIVLLPGCRLIVLGLEAGAPAARSGTVRLTADCRARGIPLAPVGTVDDVRAALRRLGIEPEES